MLFSITVASEYNISQHMSRDMKDSGGRLVAFGSNSWTIIWSKLVVIVLSSPKYFSINPLSRRFSATHSSVAKTLPSNRRTYLVWANLVPLPPLEYTLLPWPLKSWYAATKHQSRKLDKVSFTSTVVRSSIINGASTGSEARHCSWISSNWEDNHVECFSGTGAI